MTKLLWYSQMGYAVLFLILALPNLDDQFNYIASSYQLVFSLLWLSGLIGHHFKKKWTPLLIMPGIAGMFAYYIGATHFFWFCTLRYPRLFPYLIESHQLLPQVGFFLLLTAILAFPAVSFGYYLLKDFTHPGATRHPS